MPVEIRELVIKVTVSQDQPKTSSGMDISENNDIREERLSVISAAAEEVLRIIESKKER